jgi:maltose O-acetyltransferase
VTPSAERAKKGRFGELQDLEGSDSNFRAMKVEEGRFSRREWTRSVRVGDNVFVGSNVKILKGVNIGDGSVIAHGSIVTKDVPSGVIVGGNPGRVIRVIL